MTNRWEAAVDYAFANSTTFPMITAAMLLDSGDKLARIVKDLAEGEAPINGFDYFYCVLCGKEEKDENGHNLHEPDCPWRRAREIMGIDLNYSRSQEEDERRREEWYAANPDHPATIRHNRERGRE